LEEGDAVAEEFFFGKFDGGDDLGGNENGDLANDVRDGGFAVAVEATKDELLFGRKLMTRNDAGAVEAEENGVGGLRENFAVEIVADQEDGNFFRDAASDTHNLQWQVTRQRRGGDGTF
jgi:hypothetical protein